MTHNYLAFDIGTSSCKAVLTSEAGEAIAIGKGSYPVEILGEGLIEQDPAKIIEGVIASVSMLERLGADLSSVSAISFSCQISAQCLIGRDDRPLTNIISWMDKRARQEAEEWNREYTGERLEKLTGMDMVITPAYSISKLRWIKKHMPDTLSKAKYFVQIKEILIHYLTGVWVSDANSLKGVVDPSTGCVIDEIRNFSGAPEGIIPEVKRPNEIAGILLPNVRGFESVPAGTPVAVGWNDMNAAFLGMAGLPDAPTGIDLTGTSEHLGVIVSKRSLPHGFSHGEYEGLNKVPFLDQHEVYYGVTSSGGQAADWYARNIMLAESTGAFFDNLFAGYGSAPAVEANAGLVFIPYIEGERNPWNNPNACGMFFGLKREHKQIDMATAVLEGVCFALRAIYDRLPIKPDRFIVSGGAGRNEHWNQMKSDVLKTPFYRLSTTEAGCQGASALAVSALHPEMRLDEIANNMLRFDREYQPKESNFGYYEKKYRKFVELYNLFEKNFQEVKD